LLTAQSKMRGLNIIALTGVLLNVALNLVFIPSHQAQGAAFATLVTQGLVAIAHMAYAGQVFKWKGRMLRELPRAAAFAVGLALVGFALPYSGMPWIAGAAVLCLAGGLGGLALRLFDVRELVKGWKQREW
jgi:O-antigen/teichoic acid export membrane protein